MSDTPEFYSLKDFQDQMKNIVFGQDEQVNILCTVIYRHLIRAKLADYFNEELPGGFNLLIKGLTGCGKSFMIREAAKLSGLPVVFINAKTICQEGWSGRSFIELVSQGLTEQQVLEYPIIVIDEFDKILAPRMSTTGNESLHTQQSLLNYIEGQKVTKHRGSNDKLIHHMETDKFLFIFAGSFMEMEPAIKNKVGFQDHMKDDQNDDKLYKDLKDFGCIPELAGRIKYIIELQPLTRDVFSAMINSSSSDHQKWLLMFEKLGIVSKMNITDSLIEKALKKNLGARGLLQELELEINNILVKNQDLLTFYHLLGNRELPKEDDHEEV